MKSNMEIIGINEDISADSVISMIAKNKPKTYKLAKTS
jgi:hypothetical protein